MPQEGPHRRKRSRSFSPVAAKHKRSWQNTEFDRPPRLSHRRSVSPPRGEKKQNPYKPPPAYGGRRDGRGDSPLGRGPSRLTPPPPQHRKRASSRSPNTGGRDALSPRPRPGKDGPPPRRDSRPHASMNRAPVDQRQRSLSPRPAKKLERGKQDNFYHKRTPTPERGFHGKKKPRMSSISPPPALLGHSSSHHHPQSSSKSSSKNRTSGHSSGPIGSHSSHPKSSSTSSRSGAPVSGKKGEPPLPQRRVSSGGKKKVTRMTLHRRFTTDDHDPFRLEENVTIAILRNPNAEPSEEVTVKRVFDSSLFKMIHKKSAGRKPIFDREEIRVWRHDDNLADDPDFERRLVRVKSSSQGTKKPSSDSLSRMSPEVIRKAFGLQVGDKSKSRSPHREQQIRLDPRPDPRYESKYRQQIEKEERRKMSVGGGDKERKRGDGRQELDGGDTYDLRHALQRRRSDRDDSGYGFEVRRDDGRPVDSYHKGEPRARDRSSDFGPRRHMVMEGGETGGRNVVFGSGGGGFDRYDNVSPDRGWEMDRGGMKGFRGGRGRGRGHPRGSGGRRSEWSPNARGKDDFRSAERSSSLERRPRYSNSPPNSRGWRGNRGGRGRGRGRDFNSPYRTEIISPTEIDDSFKYTQHDDRDVSPKLYRGRGGRGRGRFPSRSFGSNSFRGARGAYRPRGFRGKSFGSLRDRDRSSDRMRDRSSDREWKHDMYDSLQTEEEQPHSTTMGS